MVEVCREMEREKTKEEWRRIAFLAAEIINISGKTVKRIVRADQLIKFEDDERLEADPKKMKEELAEIVEIQKKKAWTKISDKSVKQLAGK